MDFDYFFYLEKYPDLRHFNKDQAYDHWVKHGKKEGRICKRNKAINDSTNITIVVHLFHEAMLAEFLEYIQEVRTVFANVNTIFTINVKSIIEDKIKAVDSKFVVLKVENKGVDVYPFIESLRYMRKNFTTDFVLKLHTKISNDISENNQSWRKQLIEPITNYHNLLVLQHYFKNVQNIGYVGAQSCVLPKNYDKDFPQNIKGVEKMLSLFPHLPKEWADFVGGNIFWISNDALNLLQDEVLDYIEQNVSAGKPPNNLTDPGMYIEYICERLFTGILCYEKTNILINDFSTHPRSISTTGGNIDHSYFYNPKVFSMHQPKHIITK
jgi:lipopolysaccharide biosynthesis protein